MANPNPSPATRFSADNPGRAKRKGARDRLSAAFLTALADDFDAHGKGWSRRSGPMIRQPTFASWRAFCRKSWKCRTLWTTSEMPSWSS